MPTSPITSSRLGLLMERACWEIGWPEGAGRLIAAGDFGGREEKTLVRWLASDRELALRLLRWCNTPLYNLSRPFKSLEEASQVMEGQDLSRLAVLAFARGLFLPNLQIDVYVRETLWSHSFAVGAVSGLISRTCGCSDPNLVFLAWTLHDIGLCASERLDREAFAEVISQIDELSATHKVEDDLLGWNHGQLGAALLEQWGMPKEVQMAALHHHRPDQVMDERYAETVGCVAIADYFCSRSG